MSSRVLDAIGNRIVASIASEIETVERNRAMLKPPNSLDAWEAYHRGLWHMYRFTSTDNEQARHFFAARACSSTPRSRAPTPGLSFTHFQNAFLGWGDRDARNRSRLRRGRQEPDGRRSRSGRALGHGPRAVAARRARRVRRRARARRRPEPELRARATTRSPSCTRSRATRGRPSRPRTTRATLSPFDPLLFGMLARAPWPWCGSASYDEAAEWAVKAAARPNAHAHILAIAAYCLALADRDDEARAVVASIHARLPGYQSADLLAAFRISEDAMALMRRAAGGGAHRVGIAGVPGVSPLQPSRTCSLPRLPLGFSGGCTSSGRSPAPAASAKPARSSPKGRR